MFKRTFLIGVLVLSLVALLGAEARARVCIAKVGGICVKWSGSVECGIAASGLGKCTDVTLGCDVKGTDKWAVACGNPGDNSWTAPGIQIVYFEGGVSGELAVDPTTCDRNGNVFVTVYADPNKELLDNMWAADVCPNPNWYPRDAVPCSMKARDYELNADGCTVADATFDCVLPSCETLGWDKDNQKFERRQYECTRTSYHTYKDPVLCPQSPAQ
jgi:hypothetical protein